MLQITSILSHIHKGVASQDPRFIVTGDEHVLDTKTGTTLHVYDNWFKVTYEDENVVVKEDFTTDEQNIVWEIKKLITPAEVLKEREANHKPLQIARRAKFSAHYENPTPQAVNAPEAEENADIYMG